MILVERVIGDLGLPPQIAAISSDPRSSATNFQLPSSASITPTVRVAPTVAPLEETTPGPLIEASIQPTVAPEDDMQPPTTSMEPLPPVSGRTFVVRWNGDDNGKIDRFMVWVQVNDDDWIPWVETRRGEGIYTGMPGNTYRFAAWAVDMAGNWSPNVELQPQTETRVE
jgi:hypothetical protein